LTDEKELIDGLARGDLTAFREFVECYKKKVYYIALDMVRDPTDAEDVSQEVFLKVFRSFATFKRDARLGSWLYRVTYNACIDHLRKRAQAPRAVEEETLASGARDPSAVLFSSPSPDPDLSVESEMLQRKITRALEKVSPQEKAVFLLRHYDDLMLKEIAGVLDISLGSVKSYLFRAVRKLQKELGRGGAASGLEANHD
jgi:RNA polymerase sigma-70 factor (ECF subfamily)